VVASPDHWSQAFVATGGGSAWPRIASHRHRKLCAGVCSTRASRH
jgi:hypothetical protein